MPRPSIRVGGRAVRPIRTATSGGGGGGPRSLLSPSDFTYLGAFRPPAAAAGYDTQYLAGGFTHRYVSGSLRFLATTHVYSSGQVYEMSAPAPVAPADPTDYASYPTATVTRTWGDVMGTRKRTPDYPSGNANLYVYGLFWDEAAARLYWNYGSVYAGLSTDPCFGYSDLNDSDGTSTPHGPWRHSSGYADKAKGGALRIPDWFAAANCPGKTLGLGLGGGFNTNAADSMGPTLYPTTPPTPGVSEDSTVASVTALDYGFNATLGTDPVPARRDPDYEGALIGTCSGGTSTTVVLNYDPFYHGGPGSDYVGNDIIVTFSDGTSQTRTIADYATGDVVTVNSAFSGGKVPASGNAVKIHRGLSSGAFAREPLGGVGYWTFNDFLRSGWCWIDDAAGTRSKHGLVYMPLLSTGAMSYKPGGYYVQGAKHQWWVYDPAALAASIAGSVLPSAVDPARHDWAYPGMRPSLTQAGEPVIAGCSFDATTNRLYVYVKAVWSDTINWNSLIYCYQVAT